MIRCGGEFELSPASSLPSFASVIVFLEVRGFLVAAGFALSELRRFVGGSPSLRSSNSLQPRLPHGWLSAPGMGDGGTRWSNSRALRDHPATLAQRMPAPFQFKSPGSARSEAQVVSDKFRIACYRELWKIPKPPFRWVRRKGKQNVPRWRMNIPRKRQPPRPSATPRPPRSLTLSNRRVVSLLPNRSMRRQANPGRPAGVRSRHLMRSR